MHIGLYETQAVSEEDTESLLSQVRQQTDINVQHQLQTLILKNTQLLYQPMHIYKMYTLKH